MLHGLKYHVLLVLAAGALAGWLAASGSSKPASAADADKQPAANRAAAPAGAAPPPAAARAGGKKPNILVIFGDDIGQTNVSAYSMGVMGYRTPNIDRIAKEGRIFTDYYAEQSCTAG